MTNIEHIINERRLGWIHKYGEYPDTVLMSNDLYRRFVDFLMSRHPSFPTKYLAPAKFKYMGMDLLPTNIDEDDIRVSKTKFP